MTKRVISTLIVCLALVGCQPAAPPPRPFYNVASSFNDDDFHWSKMAGTGNISGQAFLKTRGGDVKTCAGNEVVLVPDNAYTRETARAAMSGQYGGVTHHANYYQYRRPGRCDATGRFKFDELPAGDWLVQALVTWEAPTGYGLAQQGGYLYQKVSLVEGGKREIIMTDADRRAP